MMGVDVELGKCMIVILLGGLDWDGTGVALDWGLDKHGVRSIQIK